MLFTLHSRESDPQVRAWTGSIWWLSRIMVGKEEPWTAWDKNLLLWEIAFLTWLAFQFQYANWRPKGWCCYRGNITAVQLEYFFLLCVWSVLHVTYTLDRRHIQDVPYDTHIHTQSPSHYPHPHLTHTTTPPLTYTPHTPATPHPQWSSPELHYTHTPTHSPTPPLIHPHTH